MAASVNTFFQIEFSSLAVGWSWWCRVGVNRVYLWWWECCRLLKYSFWWELSFFMWDSLTTDDSATPKVILLGNLQHRYLDIEVEKCMNNDIIIILPNLCWASLELGWFTDKLRYGDGDEYSCVGCCQHVNTSNRLNISDWLITGSAPLLPTLLPPVWSRLLDIFYPFVIKMCVPLNRLFQPLLGNKTISLQ